MTNKKLRIRSAFTLLIAALFAASVPVFAEHGTSTSGHDSGQTASNSSSVSAQSDTESGTTSSSGQTSHTEKSDASSGVVPQLRNGETESETSTTEGLHNKGDDMVAELKLNKHEQSPKDRQNKCESHKQGLTTKFNNIVNNSQRIQTKIDGIFSKAQTYQQTNNLNPANWDTLLAAAQSAQGASSTAIANLKAVQPTVDCNNTSVAGDVATFKVAAQQARDKLKAYRDSVKALLQALEAVKPATTTTEGSTH